MGLLIENITKDMSMTVYGIYHSLNDCIVPREVSWLSFTLVVKSSFRLSSCSLPYELGWPAYFLTISSRSDLS